MDATRLPREMVAAAADFWSERPTVPPEQEGEILGCMADGKGMPMRGSAKMPAGMEPPATGGMRPGSKKMALLGVLYSIDPLVRTPKRCWMSRLQRRPAIPRKRLCVPPGSTD